MHRCRKRLLQEGEIGWKTFEFHRQKLQKCLRRLCRKVWKVFQSPTQSNCTLSTSHASTWCHLALSLCAANKRATETTVSYNIPGNWPEPLQRTWAVFFLPIPVYCLYRPPQTVPTITPWMKIGINGTLVFIRFTTNSLVFVTLSCLITPLDPWSGGGVIRERAGLAGLMTYSWCLRCRWWSGSCRVNGPLRGPRGYWPICRTRTSAGAQSCRTSWKASVNIVVWREMCEMFVLDNIAH